jgi:hypothetical protein
MDSLNPPSDIGIELLARRRSVKHSDGRTTTGAALMAAREFSMEHEKQVDQVITTI